MPRTSLAEDTRSYKARYNIVSDLDTGAILSSSSDIAEVQRTVRTRSTVNTPGYRLMKGASAKEKNLPMNPFYYFENNDFMPQGVQQLTHFGARTVDRKIGRLSFVTVDNTPTGITPDERESVDQEALYASLSALKDVKINLGVAFGERKETGRFLQKTAGALGNVFRDLKRGDFLGAGRHLGLSKSDSLSGLRALPKKQRYVDTPAEALSNGWLALQFAVKPLLSDVYGAVETLALRGTTKVLYVTKKKTHYWSSSHKDHLWDNVPAVRSESGKYSRKYVYIFSYDNEGLSDLKSLGITNPASVAYELITLSFVVDYFVNIGQYIDLWDATLGLTFLKGCTTAFEKSVVAYHCDGSVAMPNLRYEVTGSSWNQVVSCTRTPIYSFPLPTLPHFNPRITFNRGVSMAALLYQRLKR